jgi:hypothetical protein
MSKVSPKEQEWRKANAERLRTYRLKYYQENKDRLKQKSKVHRKSNPNKVKDCNTKYRNNNKNIVNEKKMKYYYENKNNASFKVANNIRVRLRKALKNNQKVGSAVKDLGCSVKELKRYLEGMFDLDMSWDNYGLHGWHIDHIRPLSSFDLSNKEELLKACHYTNLQSLWAKDNYKKSDKETQTDSNVLYKNKEIL